eukprot:g456.t1
MPILSTLRKNSLDFLRKKTPDDEDTQEHEEVARLQAIYDTWAERRREMHANWEDYKYTGNRIWHDCQHADRISEHYIGYDKEYSTQKLSPCFLGLLAEHLGYLSVEARKRVFGDEGLLNLGFGVEGEVPIYGAWQSAKQLTTEEQKRLKRITNDFSRRVSHLDRMSKWRSTPYEFEDEQTLVSCYKNVEELFKGPHADRVKKKAVPKNSWVWPYFGLGQKWDQTLNDGKGAWRKVRPIANEKIRNDHLSPIQERLSLPVFKKHGWKLAHELEPTPYEVACGKPNNHYNGVDMKKTLEYWEKLEEDPKRPRAENIVPRSVSRQWNFTVENALLIWPEEQGHILTSSGMQNRNSRWRVWMYYIHHYLPHFFFNPATITSWEKYEHLRAVHPNVQWAHLQIKVKNKNVEAVFSSGIRTSCAVPQKPGSTHASTKGMTLSQSWAKPDYSNAMSTYLERPKSREVQNLRVGTANLGVMGRDLTSCA